MHHFEELMYDILEVDELELTDELSSFEAWDSLAVLSVIAMAGKEYHKKLSVSDIRELKTVGDLKDLLEK